MPSTEPPASAGRVAARCAAAILAATLGSLALGAGVKGQAPTPQEQRPTFRSQANFVRVDVYPTADGKPVTDLTQGDFELFEDNVPQQISTFEHVVVQAPTSQDLGAVREPATVEQARELAANSKARLFVLYLDTYHISRGGAMTVRDALVRFLRRALGPDDLIAVTTPEMPAASLTFARRTGSIEDLVDKFYHWSRRDAIIDFDPIEERYIECYPPAIGERGAISAIAREMIQRRRERVTLQSLDELVARLGATREERKAVLAVSEGWVLYTWDRGLAQATTRSANPGPLQARCDADRAALSQEDHQRDFQNLINDANRANVSFYPLDPRGLAVFDQSLAAGQLDVINDARNLHARLDSLQTLAGATDGVAIVNSNDIDAGLRRVVDDLTSYYLLGYYSSNTKLDGSYRSIKVRVRRPGVNVRARRGYRAATREEVASRAAAEAAPATPASPVAAAVSGLAKIRSDAVVQAQGGYAWAAGEDGKARPTLWIVGEWDSSAAARDEQWKAGAEVTVAVTAPDRAALHSSTQTLTRGARSFDLRVPVPAGQPAGDYLVRLTTRPVGAVLGTTETLHIAMPKGPAAGATSVGQPMFYRRGPYTGPRWLAAGDLRFRRQERLRIDVSVAGPMTAGSVRLLDRAGHPLPIPVTAVERDENGARVVSGELTLAPLGNGDYALEVSVTSGETTQKVVAAFRIIS